MPDEPSLGEVNRNVQDIKSSVNSLSGDVRKALLDINDLRHTVSENTKDIAAIQVAREKEKEAAASRKWSLIIGIGGPILVAIILAVGATALAMYVAFAKGLTP